MAETSSIRMLVVEDDRALSEVLCDELRARGHMAVAAETVAEGREQLKQSDFEVALVDLMLPDGSGIDILKQIHDEDLPMEAIVLTGYATVSTAIGARTPSILASVCTPERLRAIQTGTLIRRSISVGGPCRPWVRTLTVVDEVEISTRLRADVVASTLTAFRFQARTVTSPP